MFNFLRPAPAQPKLTMAEVAAQVAAGQMLLVDVREKAEALANTSLPAAIIRMAKAHTKPLRGRVCYKRTRCPRRQALHVARMRCASL